MSDIRPAILRRLVYEPNGCLVYRGSLDRGYGKASALVNGKKVTFRVHKHVYESLIGPVPADLTLDHLCRNRACANPHHLEPVPHGVNMRRAQPFRPPLREVEHGTTIRYSRGCRCFPCRDADNGRRRVARAAAAAAAALIASCSTQTPATEVTQGEGVISVAGTVSTPSPVARLDSPRPTPSKASRTRDVIARRSGSLTNSTAYCETGLMANGHHTYRGAVAGNRWPLGTRLQVSDSPYGPGVFTVADRIGHSSSLDFAMPGDCAGARTWGRRDVHVEVAR